MAKRYEIIPKRDPKMTGVGWGILVCSAALCGILAGEAFAKVAPYIPWDTRGGSHTKANMQLR